MRVPFCIGLYCVLLGVSGCHSPSDVEDWRTLEIPAQDFVLLPCDTPQVDAPCALVVAGGKRVLIGAPAGSGQAMRAADLRQLDAVITFSLRSRDIEGLDEVRNRSWHVGRTAPLLTIGAPGIEQVVGALNLAFEQADALYVVEQGAPPGGYDAAILVARSVAAGRTVFDTGDLKIYRVADGFQIEYSNGASAVLFPCDPARTSAPAEGTNSATIIGCDGEVGDYSWPLTMPIFLRPSES